MLIRVLLMKGRNINFESILLTNGFWVEILNGISRSPLIIEAIFQFLWEFPVSRHNVRQNICVIRAIALE